MKAVLCKSFGPAEDLSLEEVDEPNIKPGHVIVAVHASAVNFPDVLMIEGKYQSRPDFPFSPGGEFSGIVTEVADDVANWSVGDEVFGSLGHGCFAEKILVNARALRAKPSSMSFGVAAGISTTYGTSYYALKQRANLQPGETLLVLGAAGGVGLAAVELGKAMGARVIAAASSDEKLAVAKAAGAEASKLGDERPALCEDALPALLVGAVRTWILHTEVIACVPCPRAPGHRGRTINAILSALEADEAGRALAIAVAIALAHTQRDAGIQAYPREHAV